MKHWFLYLFLGITTLAFAQPKNHVKWKVDAKALGNNEYELIFKATIEEGWNTYSQFTDDAGPVPTSISYEDAKSVELIGKGKETTSKADNRKEGADPLFDGVTVIKFKHDFTITQKVRVKNPNFVIVGYITNMSCDAESCTPPSDTEFEIDLAKINGANNPNTTTDTGTQTPIDTTTQPVADTTPKPIPTPDNNVSSEVKREGISKSLAQITAGGSGGSCGVDSDALSTSGQSLWTIFLFGFLGGLFALLTPCVFPMVPLTVSYFTKRSKSRAEGIRNGLIYGLSIIVIYVGLGLIITGAFGADALNWVSTHWLPNTIFFVLFVAFAISFFGYYDIKLPSSWSNKSDQAADRGGLLGIFFMASTLALVSFSCTGPIIGTLLVEAADGGMVGPITGMTGFALALALPFGLFSMFPGWLQSLPRSGGWMNTIKVVLGFVELALAFKFLSKADLTEHWGILKYETFLGAVTLCSAGLAIYLLGFIKFPHDDHELGKVSNVSRVLGILALGLTGYIASGFMVNEKSHTYSIPSLLSGITPPACYSYFHPCDCPSGLHECFHDYYEGLAYAKKINKPIMIDFTGHGCENCRRMEDNIWIKDKINAHLNNDYVLISLYVDDREKLPEVRLTADGRKLRTVGSLWAEFEMVNFAQQSQPLYVLMSPNEQVLHAPIGATFDEEKYNNFLECGLDKFKQLSNQ